MLNASTFQGKPMDTSVEIGLTSMAPLFPTKYNKQDNAGDKKLPEWYEPISEEDSACANKTPWGEQEQRPEGDQERPRCQTL
jgi:hypothetical protein